MPEKLSSQKVSSQKERVGVEGGDGGGDEAKAAPAPAPKKEKTIVSQTAGSDGSYEIIYSDGSGEAGQGGG